MQKGRTAQRKSIAGGRPPLARPHSATLSSKATRTLIRSHHNLNKDHSKASAAGDIQRVQAIEQQLNANGGLLSYQNASTLGQSRERGGDSSKVLIHWLDDTFRAAREDNNRFGMLEVGALSTQNACSKVKCLDIRRIDLHSKEQGIEEVDFMEIPLPTDADARFDIISLSLVLNYVADPVARGEMLKRLSSFLHLPQPAMSDASPYPCVFLVLPFMCVENSRYLDQRRLQQIFESLGFELLKEKRTSKLVYLLWHLVKKVPTLKQVFKKDELRTGKSRNNFAIVLR